MQIFFRVYGRRVGGRRPCFTGVMCMFKTKEEVCQVGVWSVSVCRCGLIELLEDNFTCNCNSLKKNLGLLYNYIFHLSGAHNCALNYHSSK